MNFVKLIETIGEQINYAAFETLRDDFLDTFQAEYKALKPCKSAQEKAIQRYINKATYKDEKTAGAYTNGVTVLMLSADRPEAEKDIKKTNIAEKVLEMIKNRRPADCYFFDSVALYKALKKQEKENYFLHIDGHYYNAALVAEMLECVTENKSAHVSAEICENGALMIRQKSAAIILPVQTKSCPAAKNVNMQDFLRFLKSYEDKYLDEIRKTA